MFNALNRFISRLDGEPVPAAKENHGTFGFQVLRNSNLQLAIEPWFDFVVGINGRMIVRIYRLAMFYPEKLTDHPGRLRPRALRPRGAQLRRQLRHAWPLEREGMCQPIPLLLSNQYRRLTQPLPQGQRTRALHIPVPVDTASLGLTLQWTPLSVVSNIWHVLDVPANSPADAAGLLPYSDYILGTPEGVLHGEGGLSELVEDHIGRPLRLYVYNNEYNVTREVTIQPSRDWGGEGALGCVLGYGALHRLPAPLSEPVHGPGETMFDGDSAGGPASQAGFVPATGFASPTGVIPPDNATSPPPSSSADFLVPAQMVDAQAAPASAPPRSKKKERPHHGAPNLMDDYFKEQEKKSRELDNVPSRGSSPLPPPPKGGPPKGGPPRAGSVPPKAEEGD